MSQQMYYLASLKHTNKGHEHIVFWGKNHCGYTPVIGNYIGAYSFMEAMEISDGIDTIAFPVEVASTLIVPEPRMKNGLKFYDQVGSCILNDELSWAFIIQNGIYQPPTKKIKPEYFKGKRRT